MTHFDDPLDDLIGGTPKPASSRPAPADFVPVEQRLFTEPCPACRGTGMFTSYSGRTLGKCFKCNGEGKKTFKTDRVTREQMRDRYAEKKAKNAGDNIEAFKAEHPAIWAWMDGNTWEFAASLADSIRKFGSLTDKQLAAAQKCVDNMNARRAERNAPPAFDVDKIKTALIKAYDSGLTAPVLRFAGKNVRMKVMHGKPHWAKPDAIYVIDEVEGTVGYIEDSRFTRTRRCTPEHEETLRDASADPRDAAVRYGRITGCCSCCGRTLTDPVSIEKGIGPICESKWF